MINTIESYNNIDIKDDFMFCTVMKNPELLLGDESLKAFVNIKGDLEKLPEKMQAVLKYMDKGIVSDEFTASLDKEVNIVRNNEKWRLEYMTLQDKLDEKYEQGLEQGKAEERARYLMLYRCLKNDNRLEVLDEAELDVEILYREYGL